VHALRSIRQQRLPLVLPSQVRIKYGKRTRCAGYPNEEYDKDAVRRCLEYARRHVKEQLKKIVGMEFFDVNFSYIDLETMEEKFISVPEPGGGSLIPDGTLSPGVALYLNVQKHGLWHVSLYLKVRKGEARCPCCCSSLVVENVSLNGKTIGSFLSSGRFAVARVRPCRLRRRRGRPCTA